MLGALQRSLAAQRQLVSDAGHELRTPLTSLRINAELLAAEPGLPAAERQEVLDRMVAQVAELGQLVADVMNLARGDAPGGQAGSAEADMAEVDMAGGVDLAEVDLAGVVAAALEGARRDSPAAVFEADLEPCVVAGHAERLKTAVRNLLDNAAKFGPPGIAVQVRLHAGELTERTMGPASRPATCRTCSTASTGRRRPAACPAWASGWPSSARWPKATAERSGPQPGRRGDAGPVPVPARAGRVPEETLAGSAGQPVTSGLVTR